jgi:hypothetical protein
VRLYIWGHPTHPTYSFSLLTVSVAFRRVFVRWLDLILPSGSPCLCLCGVSVLAHALCLAPGFRFLLMACDLSPSVVAHDLCLFGLSSRFSLWRLRPDKSFLFHTCGLQSFSLRRVSLTLARTFASWSVTLASAFRLGSSLTIAVRSRVETSLVWEARFLPLARTVFGSTCLV